MAGGARRKGDPKGEDFTKVRTENITWKWLAGICVSIFILVGGWYINNLNSQHLGDMVAMDTVKEKVNKQAVDQATTAEQVKSMNGKVDDLRKDVSDIRSDLKLILQNQQQQILQQQQGGPAKR